MLIFLHLHLKKNTSTQKNRRKCRRPSAPAPSAPLSTHPRDVAISFRSRNAHLVMENGRLGVLELPPIQCVVDVCTSVVDIIFLCLP